MGVPVVEGMKTLKQQGGACGICRKPCSTGRKLAIDHDHETGEFRGWLCLSCNAGLGQFKDNQDLLLAAIDYLVSPPAQR
jgi:hypothetical protein